MPLRMLTFIATVVLAACVGAADIKPPEFESDLLPLIRAKCVECHNGQSRKAELDLTSRAGVLKGGESGTIVTPGKLDESLLYEMLHEGLMPPPGKPKLTPAEIDKFAAWIKSGAKFAPATEPEAPAAVALSQHDILPIVLMRCTVCHGRSVQSGGLDLRTKAAMLKGGKSGPAIVLGKPDESLLVQKARSGEMPPNKRLQEASVKPITTDEIEKIAQWIAAGAPEVDVAPDVATTEPDPLVSDADRQFWSFQPPKDYQPPRVAHADRVRNPIDAFVLQKLEAAGLSLSPEADPLTLLRRVSIDLTGLPPTPAEVEEFLSAIKPRPLVAETPDRDQRSRLHDDAYASAVERLLASPRYGERWGRYWLDLAGYADSEGKRSQDPIRPYAYRYRDYVIRALNADKPYDRFLLEQLAGDELADYEHAPEMTRELVDNLVATGFLKMAPDGTGSNVVNFTPERLEVIADEMEILGSAVLGLTIKCARCHSHKYDPIPQRDYYRLMACFKGALDEHDWLKPSAVKGQTEGKLFGARLLTQATREELAEVEVHNGRIQAEIDRLQRELKTEAAAHGKEVAELRKNDKEFGKRADAVDAQVKKLEAQKLDPPAIQALWDRGEPSPTYIYRRGDYLSPGRLVGPGVLSALTDGRTPFAVTPPYPAASSTGRRLALARWLTSPEHPLTARVMVNRLWKHHFGVGIVKTLDNFGKTGMTPSHPELLDWLAREFVRQGWSLKAMHRMMVLSSVYRQSSIADSELRIADSNPQSEIRNPQLIDPDNRLLSRMPLQRLDAESLRDTLLFVAGKLDERRYGPADGVTARADGLMMPDEGSDGSYRRTVYVRQRRKEIPTILETFDLPQMNPNCIERVESTVAAQALHLMNNEQVHELAQGLAERVQTECPSGDEKQVERAFLIVMSRPPLAAERTASIDALRKLTITWRVQLKRTNEAAGEQNDFQSPEFKALTTFCHTLLNSAAFLYVD